MGRAPSASAPGEAREAGDAPSALQLRAEAVAQCLEQGSIYEGELGFSAEWTCDDAMWFYVGEADNDECEEWILTWIGSDLPATCHFRLQVPPGCEANEPRRNDIPQFFHQPPPSIEECLKLLEKQGEESLEMPELLSLSSALTSAFHTAPALAVPSPGAAGATLGFRVSALVGWLAKHAQEQELPR
ncbi:unnamed protein product, partial [Durusdinium trenchii]